MGTHLIIAISLYLAFLFLPTGSCHSFPHQPLVWDPRLSSTDDRPGAPLKQEVLPRAEIHANGEAFQRQPHNLAAMIWPPTGDIVEVSLEKRKSAKDLKYIACSMLKSDPRLGTLQQGRRCFFRRAPSTTGVSRAWHSRSRTASQSRHMVWNEYQAAVCANARPVYPTKAQDHYDFFTILCAPTNKRVSFDEEPMDADRERNARGERGDPAPDVPVAVFILGSTVETAASRPFGNPGDEPPERPRGRLGEGDFAMLLFPGAYALALAILILCHLIAIYNALSLIFGMFSI